MRTTTRVALTALLIVAPAYATAQTGPLTIQNGVFHVNGQKKFIQSISYFGALRDAVLDPARLVGVLTSLQQNGYTGVRIFGMWWWDEYKGVGCSNQFDPYPAIKGNGTLNTDPLVPLNGKTPQALPAPYSGYGYHNSVLGRLQFVLDVAYQKGLIVDLTFAGETVQGMWDINDKPNSLLRQATAFKRSRPECRRSPA